MTVVSFDIPGIPQPGGSKRAFVNRKTGRAIVTDDCKRNKEWRSVVALAARDAFDGAPLEGALKVEVIFRMPRPKYHFGTGRNAGKLKPNAPKYHTVKPDATKLWRSTEDALTNILWRDDAQVAEQLVVKRYAHPHETPGAWIWVELINQGETT